MSFIIMLLIIIILTILDMLTTFKALELGASELNPIVLATNFNIPLKIGLSIIYVILSYILYRSGDKTAQLISKATTIFLIVCLGVIVVNNIVVIAICMGIIN